jgi:hypothetical protein
VGKFIVGTNDSNTAKLIIDTSGNVGIGTTSPGAKLQIDVDGEALRMKQVIAGDDTWQAWYTAAGARRGYFGYPAGGSDYIELKNEVSGGHISLSTTGTGNVGIGTTTPVYTLDVVGTSRFTQPVIVGTPTQTSHAATKNYVDSAVTTVSSTQYWALSGSNLYPNSTSYNVGIGTTGPGQQLTVEKVTPNGVGGSLMISNPVYATNVGAETQLLFSHWPNGSLPLRYAKIHTVGADIYGNVDRLSLGVTNSVTDVYSDILTLKNGGNVGIATTTPQYTLSIVSPNAVAASFNQPIIVGTPTQASHAATKNYVDSSIGQGSPTAYATTSYACNADATCEMQGANLSGGDILGVDKLTVTTIDPLYMIGGSKYSTYVASIVGGVKEEYVGKGILSSKYQVVSSKYGEYFYTIDFSKIERGSDLWVWYKAVDFSANNVEILATPIGIPVPIAYEIKGDKIIFSSSIPDSSFIIPNSISFSYRLIGKRFDWQEWPTYAKDQSEQTRLIVK